MSVEIGVLGPLVVTREGTAIDVGRGGRRQVLCALALAQGRPVATEVLIDQLWEESAPRNARTIIHGHISALRKALGGEASEAIVTLPDAYALGDVDLDATRFLEAAAEGEAFALREAWGEAAATLGHAESLWRGGVCDSVPLAGASAAAARELELLRLRATLVRIDAQLQLGRHGHVIPELERLATAHPLDEDLAGRLALARFQAGRQADAMAVLRQTRIRLREELGVDPGPELAEIEEAILRHDPSLRPEHTIDVLRRSHTRWIAALRVRIVREDFAVSIAPLVARLQESLTRDGAVVVAIPGEGLLAAWGLTETEADVASRAVRGAEHVRNIRSPGLTTSIAIATARAETHEADLDAALLDAPAAYRAATLVRDASAGEILVDEVTADLMGGTRERTRRGAAWLLGRRRSDSPALHGRAYEFRLIRDVFDACVDDSRAGLIQIVGPGGIGKTALAEAFLDATGVRTVRVACGREPAGAILERLEALLGGEEPATASIEESFLRLRTSLIEAARIEPVVILVDDIHHIGDAAASIMERLTRSVLRHPIVSLVTSRHSEPALEGPAGATTISLMPLDEEAARALLADQGATDPIAIQRMLVVSDGNPLYLRQSAALERHEQTPPSVDLVLHTRLEHLARAERSVLEHLSVLDPDTEGHLLPEIVPDHIKPAIPDALSSLHREGWLRDSGDQIAHELLMEAVREAMPAQARMRAHARAAALQDGDELPSAEAQRVAEHLAAAIDDGPGDMAHERRRARDLFASVAANLVASGERREAAASLSRAVEVGGTDDPRGADLAIQHIQLVADVASPTDAAALILDRGAAIRSAGGEVAAAYLEVVHAQMAVFEGGDPHVGVRARERIERVLGTLEGSSHAAGLEAALYTLAWLDFSRGHLRDADARMPRVLELRRALGRPTTAYIPSSLLDGPTPLEERTLAALRSDAAEAAGSVFAERNGQLAGLYAIAGHPQIADAILGQALDVAVALALPSTIGSVELDAGLLCLRTGQIEGATRHFAASEHAFRGSGEGSFRATALGHLARALALAGDVEGAHRAVTQARGLMDEDDLLTVIAADSAEGLARATMGDPEGIQLAIRAIRRARDTEFLVARCDALVDLAHACVQLGEIDAAAAAASEAIEGFDQKLARGAVSAIRKGFAAAFDRSPTRTGSSDDPAE